MGDQIFSVTITSGVTSPDVAGWSRVHGLKAEIWRSEV
jgi:hypothetical protein